MLADGANESRVEGDELACVRGVLGASVCKRRWISLGMGTMSVIVRFF